jgi:hypothetical protein
MHRKLLLQYRDQWLNALRGEKILVYFEKEAGLHGAKNAEILFVKQVVHLPRFWYENLKKRVH